MDRAESDSPKPIGSVKEAVNLFGDRINGVKPDFRKTQMPFPGNTPSRARELHLAKRHISRFRESKISAEYAKAQAESELVNAKNQVKDLTSRIEESNLKARTQKRGLEALKKPEIREDKWATMAVSEVNEDQHAQVMKELELVKKELSKIKLDMAYLMKTKSRADKETEATSSKIRSISSSVEALRKEIEEVNEEQVLVELARIEAAKELGDIETQRAAEAAQFSSTLEIARKRMNQIVQEIEYSKGLENKLAITNFEVDVLQNELKLVKTMDEKLESSKPSRKEAKEIRKKDGEDEENLLRPATEELEAARKELHSIREEGFQFMSSMDTIREELKHVSIETARMRKMEEKADSTVQNLNSKLLRAKSKLEAVSSAEEKAKAMVSNLTSTLQQLKTENEAGKKERELIREAAESIRLETQNIETDIDLSEEKLQAAMQELEAIKASEAIALENLKNLTEKIMRTRASTSQHNSWITISNFEYKYLKGRAEGAEEIADKKVAAAQAWIEALKASEKEILMKTEIAHRKIRELKVGEEQEVLKREKYLKEKTSVVNKLGELPHPKEEKGEGNSQREATFLTKPMKDHGSSTPMRRVKARRPSSPGAFNLNRSSSIALKKRRKAMPNIGKLFSNKRDEEKLPNI